MAETLLTFDTPVRGRDGTTYEARACGGPMDDGRWQGWIEFVPIDGGRPVRSPRETTQPNRMDTEYWATGLTTVYLEGALQRALDTPLVVPRLPPQPSIFKGPAPYTTAAVEGPVERDGIRGEIVRRLAESRCTRHRPKRSGLNSAHLIRAAIPIWRLRR